MDLSSALICLALNVYFEARGEPEAGKYAVAHVTLNRVRQKRSSVCKEVFRPRQFSWTAHYRLPPKNDAAWKNALMIASRSQSTTDPTRGSTYFFNPKYSRHTRSIVSGRVLKKRIGDHVFYAER